MPRRRAIAALLLTGIALVVAVLNGIVLLGGRDLTDAAAPADCALVLGAGVLPDGRPSDVLRDRLDEAVALYRSGRTAKVLVSGDHRTLGYDEPGAMRDYLVGAGVPRDAIYLDHAGLDTFSSAWRARHVFGAERVVVVTQRFHLARAVWLARQSGLVAEGRAADRRRYRGFVWLELREIVSRSKAVLDVATHRAPRFTGPPVDLDGPASATEG